MEDLGSGTFVDFSRFGLDKEPTVQESLAAGVDVVTFSGDKLLGGPQAGIIVGKKEIIQQIRKNPLTRALRIDKLTLSALESTLRIYRDMDRALEEIPTLRLLARPLPDIEKSALQLADMLKGIDDERLEVSIRDDVSKAGGGSLPVLELPSKCIGIRVTGLSVNRVEKQMRLNSPPVIGRIEADTFVMDLRTVLEDDLSDICEAIANILKKELG
jgi:L-seryl-tRNA(Ser) seleniumtransferase